MRESMSWVIGGREISGDTMGAVRTVDLLTELKPAIADVARRYGAGNIRIFGSTARGEDRAGSDIDILVSLERDRTLLDLVGPEQGTDEAARPKGRRGGRGGPQPLPGPAHPLRGGRPLNPESNHDEVQERRRGKGGWLHGSSPHPRPSPKGEGE